MSNWFFRPYMDDYGDAVDVDHRAVVVDDFGDLVELPCDVDPPQSH